MKSRLSICVLPKLIFYLFCFNLYCLCMADKINHFKNVSSGKRKTIKLLNIKNYFLVTMKYLIRSSIDIGHTFYWIFQKLFWNSILLLLIYLCSPFWRFTHYTIFWIKRASPKYIYTQTLSFKFVQLIWDFLHLFYLGFSLNNLLRKIYCVLVFLWINTSFIIYLWLISPPLALKSYRKNDFCFLSLFCRRSCCSKTMNVRWSIYCVDPTTKLALSDFIRAFLNFLKIF